MKRLFAALAAVVLTCAPALGQSLKTIPTAGSITGSERMAAVQGSGCATNTTPCATVAVTPSQIATFVGGSFQPKDADLDAIAALATTSIGRSLLTQADAASLRSVLGVTATGQDTTYLYRANNLSGLSDTAVARSNLGVTATGADPAYAKLTGAAFTGTVTASNLSGTNTGDQTSVSGNAGTATKLATARKLNGVAFDGSADITLNAVDSTARLAAANNLSDLASAATARTNLGLGSIATQAASGVALTGGSINGTTIGGSTAAAATFTTVITSRVCASPTVCEIVGTGSPLNAVNADVGSTYRRTDGGTGSTFYVKESGSQNAQGWVAK